jgi:hypothetical protein
MKRKNLKSVVHNFAHSFQAFDFMKSQYTVLQELSVLFKKSSVSNVEIDFMKKIIQPVETQTKVMQQIMEDYIDWLPELCLSQNVDISIIKKLLVKVEIDFLNAEIYKSSRNERVLKIITTYTCVDDQNNEIKDCIEEKEVVNKQNYEKS